MKPMNFTNWLERKGGSPREVADRESAVDLGVQSNTMKLEGTEVNQSSRRQGF